MARPNPSSLRFRATVWTAAAIAALVLASALAINWAISRTVRSAFDNVLLEQAEDRALLLENGADPSSLVTVTGEEVVVAVIDRDGAILAASGTPEPEALADLPTGVLDVTITVVEDHDGDELDGHEDEHGEALRAAVFENANGQRVVVGNEAEEARRALGVVRWVLAIGGPAIALVASLVVLVLSGRALRPVFRMRDDLNGVVRAGGRVSEPGTNDEIDELAITLNSVLAELERQSEARRQFVADASHELKSPVANARALIETDGSRRRTLGELDRLQAIVDDLLYLARTDEPVVGEPTQLDLDDIVFDEAERAASHTERRIDASGVQPARVIADRGEVARAVRNLIDNAVRHSESDVAISVEPGDGTWIVVVDDDGPGVPVVDRDRVFERFTRLEGARARSEGGTGLGLSIVASIASRNGGAVRVGEAPSGGARFELVVPADVS